MTPTLTRLYEEMGDKKEKIETICKFLMIFAEISKDVLFLLKANQVLLKKSLLKVDLTPVFAYTPNLLPEYETRLKEIEIP